MSLQRKVQQIGKSGSYILTLPKEWCQTYDISQGSEVVVSVDHLHPGTLLISVPSEQKEERKADEPIRYDLITEDRVFQRMILGSYLNGSEIIRIIEIPDSKQIKVRKEIKKIISKLYVSRETEIIDKSIEIHVSNEFISPITVIGDLYMKAKNMIEDAFNAWKAGDASAASEISQRDEDADKLYFYIVRMLKKMLNDPILASEILKKENVVAFTLLDSLDLRVIASYLENLADSADELSQRIMEGVSDRSELTAKTEDEFRRLMMNLEMSYNSFINRDDQRVQNIINEIRSLREGFVNSFPPSLAPMIQEILECIIDIADLVGNY